MQKAALRLAWTCSLCLSAASFANPVKAQPNDAPPRLTLQSKILGEERSLLVSTPERYTTSNDRYPVFYLTDGKAHFEHTAATVQFLADAGRIPQMLVVGIPNTDRNRDLTPSRAGIARRDGSQSKYPTSGGADDFLEFFSTELIPFIDSTYRTQPYRILAGHSFGGLLVVHTLATRPELFDAYIAASPALPWDDHLVVRAMESRLGQDKDLDTTFVLTVGDEPRLQASYERFVAVLESAKRPAFRWRTRQFPDENHRSVLLLSHYFGLREIFAGWLLPRDESTGAVAGGFEALRTHYAGLTERYGYPVPAPERLISRLGYQALSSGDVTGAVAVFRYSLAQHPESARSHASLGEA
ncbi:MAG: alpha/beta hydrolase-fold protein, partial [Acidobacteriota bacterium]